jgi:hypothetical protein
MSDDSDSDQQPFFICEQLELPPDQLVQAAQTAVRINPRNHMPVQRLMQLIPGFKPQPEHLAMMTTRYWGGAGVTLTVGFLEPTAPELMARIIAHMNAWGDSGNVEFTYTESDADVRITLVPGTGYSSYVGTEIRTIAADQPTMKLGGFTMATSEAEFKRVVRHETGHTLGYPHEHLRRELVQLIDPDKAIAYYRENYNWNEAKTRFNVLTPLEETTLFAVASPDTTSIMCYGIPGEATYSGEPIPGGKDIDASDAALNAIVYPK